LMASVTLISPPGAALISGLARVSFRP